jgi:hypothetical protein
MVESVRKAGGDAKLTILPNEGHSICDIVFNQDELTNWMLAQRRSSREPQTLSAEQ